jgi:Uma2 family endonuclease
MSIAPEPPVVRLGPGLAGTRMTPEEFDAVVAYDEDYRYELIEGLLVVLPPPEVPVLAATEWLSYALRTYQDGHPEGRSLDATLCRQYVYSANDRRLADRLVWAGLGRLPKRNRDVPTIAVEFISASRRDRRRDYVEKRAEYLAAGVREYWIVDRFRRCVTVCRAEGADLVVPEGESYTCPLLPGFVLPVAPLLAAADQWGDADESR